MKKALAVLLGTLMIALMLLGCGKASVTGTYKMKSVSDGSTTYTAEQFQTILDLMASATGETIKVDDVFSLELNGDGTFTIAAYEEEPVSGTYTLDGEKISMTGDGETIEGTLKNGELTLTMDGSTMVFQKK